MTDILIHSTIDIPVAAELDVADARTENSFLKSEITSLNLEIARLLQKTKRQKQGR